MLKLRKGCTVPFPEKLVEGYEIRDSQIIANVSADKIIEVMEHFICLHSEPLFFILELPVNREDEIEIRPGIVNSLHKDVYYIDGCTEEESITILLRVGNLLVNDGLCSFGFGGHDSQDEIMFGKYNVTTIFSSQKEKYRGCF